MKKALLTGLLCMSIASSASASLVPSHEQWRYIPTMEQSVCYTFGGVTKTEPLQNLLASLQENNIHATFFITKTEYTKYKKNVDLIKSYGHDFGIGIIPMQNATEKDYIDQINFLKDKLNTKYVRVMYKADDLDTILNAIEKCNCIAITQGVNVVQTKHKDAKSADEVMNIFGKWITSLNRGEIVYARTDYYSDPTLLPKVMMEIKKRKIDNIGYSSFEDNNQASKYSIKSIQDLDKETFIYPVKEIPNEVMLKPKEIKDFNKEFYKRYIGAPEVSPDDRMLEFTIYEMDKADKTGTIHSVKDNTIFLTFDDWGNDDSINKILYVLDKHKVNGTFFIIGKNIHNNPALLRTIAKHGNEIGSHTFSHTPMAIWEGEKLVSGTKEINYREDIVESHRKIASIMGDIKLPNGRYALTKLFRPPTLAVSKSGCKDILESGYDFIVNGKLSTEDYGAVSYQSLVGIMNNGIRKDGKIIPGAIIIMHMSSTSDKTARALDILLTHNESLPEGHPEKFKVGLLGDYLTDDYDQTKKY